MEIIITKWALNSYLELRGKNTFTDEEYRKIIRPDVLLLYVKSNEKVDKRKLARFKVYLELVRQKRYTIQGRLT
jgi:hypothetical protein